MKERSYSYCTKYKSGVIVLLFSLYFLSFRMRTDLLFSSHLFTLYLGPLTSGSCSTFYSHPESQQSGGVAYSQKRVIICCKVDSVVSGVPAMYVLLLAFSLAQQMWFWMSPLWPIMFRCFLFFFVDVCAASILHWQTRLFNARYQSLCAAARCYFNVAGGLFMRIILSIKHFLFSFQISLPYPCVSLLICFISFVASPVYFGHIFSCFVHSTSRMLCI